MSTPNNPFESILGILTHMLQANTETRERIEMIAEILGRMSAETELLRERVYALERELATAKERARDRTNPIIEE